MNHRALSADGYRNISGGKSMTDGKIRRLRSGRTLANGKLRDIEFGIPIVELDVGETVHVYIDGEDTEFLIVNHGFPSDSDLYDESCFGTWLLSKDVIETITLPEDYGYYHTSGIPEYLNGLFLSRIDANTRSVISSVKIPYYDGGKNVTGEQGLECNVFLLAYSELGFYSAADGDTLAYFEDTKQGDPRLIAHRNGVAESWMVRTTHDNSTAYAGVADNGYPSIISGYVDEVGIRVAMIVPFETCVAKTSHRILGTTSAVDSHCIISVDYDFQMREMTMFVNDEQVELVYASKYLFEAGSTVSFKSYGNNGIVFNGESMGSEYTHILISNITVSFDEENDAIIITT